MPTMLEDGQPLDPRVQRELDRERIRNNFELLNASGLQRRHAARQMKISGQTIESVDTQSRAHGGEIAWIAGGTKIVSTAAAAVLAIASIGVLGGVAVATGGAAIGAIAIAGASLGAISFGASHAAAKSKQMKDNQFKDRILNLQMATHDLNSQYLRDNNRPFSQPLTLGTKLKTTARRFEYVALAGSATSFIYSVAFGATLPWVDLGGRFLSAAGSLISSEAHGSRVSEFKDVLKRKFENFAEAADRLNPEVHDKAIKIVKGVFAKEGLRNFKKEERKYESWVKFYLYKSMFDLLNSGKMDINEGEEFNKVVENLSLMVKGLVKNGSFDRSEMRHIDSQKSKGNTKPDEFSSQKSMAAIDALPIFEKKAQLIVMETKDPQGWKKSEEAAKEIFGEFGLDPKASDVNKAIFFQAQKTIAQHLIRSHAEEQTKNNAEKKQISGDKDDKALADAKLVVHDALKPYVEGKAFNKTLIWTEYRVPDFDQKDPYDKVVAHIIRDVHDRGEEGIRPHFDNDYHPAKILQRADRKLREMNKPQSSRDEKETADHIDKLIEEAKQRREMEKEWERIEKKLRRRENLTEEEREIWDNKRKISHKTLTPQERSPEEKNQQILIYRKILAGTIDWGLIEGAEIDKALNLNDGKELEADMPLTEEIKEQVLRYVEARMESLKKSKVPLDSVELPNGVRLDQSRSDRSHKLI